MNKHIMHGLAAALLAIAGCGGGGVSIPEGPMPSGGSYTGVWHSPQYGRMEMTQTGQQVVGSYEKDERTGRIQGSVQGNVMRFEWTEEREMVAGRPVTTRGRGYFRYEIGADGDHYIRGEWGVDSNQTGGGEWNAVRDRRARPSSQSASPESSGGEESDVTEFDTADDSGGGGGGGGSGSRSRDSEEEEGGGLDLEGL